MRVIACLLLTLFASSALFGVCNGAVWFEGHNPQEPQEIRLNMQHTKNDSTSLPDCKLILNETKPHIVNLTIIVSTAALFYQTGNFETWFLIDSQEPEKLFGILDSRGSAAGQLYKRQYIVILGGLGDSAHFIKIRVAGDYYGPGPAGGNYDCEGSATVIIGDQTLTSPTPTPTQLPTINTGAEPPIKEPFPTTLVAIACGVSVAVIGIGLFLYFNKRGRGRNS